MCRVDKVRPCAFELGARLRKGPLSITGDLSASAKPDFLTDGADVSAKGCVSVEVGCGRGQCSKFINKLPKPLRKLAEEVLTTELGRICVQNLVDLAVCPSGCDCVVKFFPSVLVSARLSPSVNFAGLSAKLQLSGLLNVIPSYTCSADDPRSAFRVVVKGSAEVCQKVCLFGCSTSCFVDLDETIFSTFEVIEF